MQFTTNKCPFEVAYGFKPPALIDLLPLPLQEQTNMDASKCDEYVKKIHEKAKEEKEKRHIILLRRPTNITRR
jgi:protein-tyrosine phosphatase